MNKEPPNLLNTNAVGQVYAYHQRTKHQFQRYAAGPGYLDWATQPDPFRRYDGAPKVVLPLREGDRGVGYADLFRPERLPVAAPGLNALGLLFELAFGLSAWKQFGGDRWALRCNPSSGNLHPTEAYLLVSGVPDLATGVYHYVSYDHSLEGRCATEWSFDGFLIALSSVHWREAWKYGERAFRYCQHDVGHAFGALNYAAAVLGWTVRLLEDWADDDIAGLLGIDRAGDFGAAEREAPDLLCWTGPRNVDFAGLDPRDMGLAARRGVWCGQANRLSLQHHHDWPIIEEVDAASRKPRTQAAAENSGLEAPLLPCRSESAAVDIIRHRRSAQAFDGVTAIPASALCRMLDATLPRTGIPPFAGWPWRPRVHLVLFVHRVVGLAPGLYVFFRRQDAVDSLRPAFKKDFEWLSVTDCPAHFQFFRLLGGDVRKAAKILSCHQDIAGDSAFSLGMLAEFDDSLKEGPWVYRRLFWETGQIGQALYLEAEAAGVRGTGIGCFFDDPVHELLGISDTRLQSLYHFTIGGSLVDNRLQTLPAYAHIDRS